MPTALRGHGKPSKHAHAEPWAWHPAKHVAPMLRFYCLTVAKVDCCPLARGLARGFIPSPLSGLSSILSCSHFFLICHFFSEMIRSWRAFTYGGVKEPLTEPYQIGISGSGWYSLYLGVALAHSAAG